MKQAEVGFGFHFSSLGRARRCRTRGNLPAPTHPQSCRWHAWRPTRTDGPNLRYLIVDLEATCWERGSIPSRMETIEIGAVMLACESGPELGEFNAFVRPVAAPTLSPFCIELTSIRQHDVDAADVFPQVLRQFIDWAKAWSPFVWCSWGDYDLKQLRSDCRRHGLTFPPELQAHINLKRELARSTGDRPRTMKDALRSASLPLAGRHHRAIDDARNIVRLAQRILPGIASLDSNACVVPSR